MLHDVYHIPQHVQLFQGFTVHPAEQARDVSFELRHHAEHFLRLMGDGEADLHGTRGDEGHVCHEGAEADKLPHGLHQAFPGVLWDVLWDVCVVGDYQGDCQHFGIQDGREHQQTCRSAR